MSSSSTFSSDSSIEEGSFRPGKAFYSWLSLLLIANLLVAAAGARGLLTPGLPVSIIQGFVEDTAKDSDVWLIGNSTLAAAVDEKDFEEQAKLRVVKMELGSSTFSAQVALAEFCLGRSSNHPEVLCMFATKDDFNLNGMRAETSESYFRVLRAPSLTDVVGSKVPVFLYSASIRKESRRSLGKLRLALQPSRKRSSEPGGAGPEIDNGKFSPDKAVRSGHLAEVGRDYEFDNKGAENLAELRRRYPEIRFVLVHPPVTHGPETWQSEHHPDRPWSKYRREVQQDMATIGVDVLDLSSLFPSTGEYFKDFYHLNSRGGEEFTEHFVGTIGGIIKEGQSSRKSLSPSP